MHGVPRLGALAALVFLTVACGDGRPEGWTDETHGKNAAPAYETVFPSDKVQRLDISISAEDWQAMQDDMTDMLAVPARTDGLALLQGLRTRLPGVQSASIDPD